MSQTDTTASISADEVFSWLADYVAKATKTPRATIDGSASLDAYGMDSAQSVDMLTDLEDMLGLSEELPTDLFFESDNLRETANAVAKIANERRGAA